jgi:hypothetical protein
VIKGLQGADQRLQEETEKQSQPGTEAKGLSDEGGLSFFKKVVDHYKKELSRLKKQGEDLGKTLQGIKERLDSAAKLLENNCPPKKDVAKAPGDAAPSDDKLIDATTTSIKPGHLPLPDQTIAVAPTQPMGEGGEDCVVVAPDDNRVCGGDPPPPRGTTVPASTEGWWCSDDKEWAKKMSEKLKAPTRREIESALRESTQFFSIPDRPLASRAAALGLRKPEKKVLTAPEQHTFGETCYTDEDVKEIIEAIVDAVKRADAKASSPGGGAK